MPDTGSQFDKFREACGVYGVFSPGEDVARITYFGLYALQHRGQESAGIATSSGGSIGCYTSMGLVTRAFSEKILRMMKGDAAIGHVRYSTTGSSVEANAQPIVANGKREIALAHNGNLVNAGRLREELELAGEKLESTTDSEVIAKMIARDEADTVEEAIINTCRRMRGAYSVAVLCDGRVFGFRDPHGIRPLCVGELNGHGWVMASESCGLNIVGAELEREVLPGELVVIDEDGLRSLHRMESPRQATCVFEFIYFARPDSYIIGRSLYQCRKRMGESLARESPAPGDVVISVPDSGTPAAIGFAKASGIPYEEGLIKNRYVGRTFISPDQRIRALGIKIKLNPLAETIRGKKVVLVDDSIVRGTTSSQIVAILREFGAKEIHMRVSSPPVKNPCFYGIDTAERGELLASSREVDDIREFLKADSLAYLSIEGMIEAIEVKEDSFCMACFNGDYPIAIPQQLHLTKLTFERDSEERPGAEIFRKLIKR
ncbi:MAG: amidophosphoribosyltransferase [bacterium]